MAQENVYGMDFNIRSLGAVEAKLVLSLEERRQAVVDVEMAATILGDRHIAQLALLRLVKKGWVERVSTGRYLVHSPSTGYLDTRIVAPIRYAGNIASGTYAGWWAAAEYHGLTWQHPTLIRVASLRQLKPRSFEDCQIEFVKVKENKFFGFETSKDGATVSTISKTVVDCVDKPKFAGGFAEVGVIVGTALDRVDVAGIVSDAIRNGSVSTLQRLGFFLDTVRPTSFPAVERETLRNSIGSGSRAKMGSPTFADGDFGYQAAWNLQVNLNKASFMNEVDRFGART